MYDTTTNPHYFLYAQMPGEATMLDVDLLEGESAAEDGMDEDSEEEDEVEDEMEMEDVEEPVQTVAFQKTKVCGRYLRISFKVSRYANVTCT